MYPVQILYLKSFLEKHYEDYLNGQGKIWFMLKDYFYGSHNCPEELSEVLDKLENLLNNHTMELLRYTVLTDKRTKKQLKS